MMAGPASDPGSPDARVIALHPRWSTRRNDRPAAPVLFGRGPEVAKVSALTDALAAGLGAVVAVKGQAGIGKTALAALLAESVEAAGLPVIWARCDQLDQIRPFGCLIDALDCRLQHPDPARRRVAEALVTSAGAGIDPFRFDNDGAWRFPVQEALLDLVLGLVDAQPLMLFVDDVHWADAGTLGVLVALARRCAAMPLLVGWTVRTANEPAVLEHLADRLGGDVHEIAVLPLGSDDTRRLGARIAGHSVDATLGARLDRAGGNPFFISALVADPDASSPGDALLARTRGLPAPTVDVLAVAAVVGMHFTIVELVAMTDAPSAELHAHLAPAIADGLVTSFGLGRFAFAHELIRAAVESELPATMLAALHRDAARAMRDAGADEGVVAHHLARGARAGDEDAAEQIRLACAQVVRHDARSAAELLATAASLCVPGSSTWIAATADRVMALQWAGDGVASLALVDQALQQPMSRDAAARLRIARGAALGLLGDMVAAAEQYRTLGDDETVAPAARAQLLAELATIDAWGLDRTRARSYAQQALELGRATGNIQAELQALCAWSTQATFDGDLREGIDRAREAVERGRSYAGLAPARELYLALALGLADEHEEAAIWMQSGLRSADEVSDLWLLSRYQLGRMSLGVLSGDWDAATADAEAVISLNADTGMISGIPHAPALAGIIALLRGADASVIHRYRDVATSIPMERAELSGLVFHAWFEALAAEATGDVDGAAATMGFLFDSTVAAAPLVQTWVAAELVRLALLAADQDRAVTTTRATRALADRVGSNSSLGTAALCEAMVARADRDRPRAAAHALTAAKQLRTAGWRPSLLRALRLALEVGSDVDGSIAREVRDLEQALRITAMASGAATLPASPSRVAMPAADDVFRWLTPMESTVADLVADGLTNPAIAARLSISKRTVEYHISNLYSKLGAANRVAVANLVRSR